MFESAYVSLWVLSLSNMHFNEESGSHKSREAASELLGFLALGFCLLRAYMEKKVGHEELSLENYLLIIGYTYFII